MASSQEDRRRSSRVDAVVAVQLDSAERYGVTRDVSERGLLLATRFLFSAGDRLEVSIYGPSGIVQRNARVLRVEETPPEEPWRYRIALELDEPLPKEVIEDGAKAAARLLPSSKPPSGGEP